MKRLHKPLVQLAFTLSIAGLVSACGSNEVKMTEKASAQPAMAKTTMDSHAEKALEIYEVHHEGRIHVFYDRKLYSDFLALGETPFRLTRIGAGPKGETLVFGLTKHDKKKPGKVAVINLFDGKIASPEKIYAEMRRDGRIYVFNDYEDMTAVRQSGNPNLFYTEIGAGPKGETVVYVLNEETKKKRPDDLIAAFKQHNS
jgi:hypothetical protein